jgi:hypothetical protein
MIFFNFACLFRLNIINKRVLLLFIDYMGYEL